ncbi:hypothetical protein PMIN07_008231 [Paraphaeosphaeria minitans]
MSTSRTPTSSTASGAAEITPMKDGNLYFFDLDKPLKDKKKVIFAATYMRGDAGSWIYPYLEKYLGMDHDNDDDDYANEHADAVDIIKDYNNFKKCLKQLFRIANKDSIAKAKIQTIT